MNTKTFPSRYSAIITCAFAGLFGSQALTADTLVLNPTDNVYIRDIQTNQGANPLVLIGDTTTADDFLRGLFSFDLSDPLLSGATINSATLTLTVDNPDASSANASVTINFHELDASFTNDGATWDSRDGSNNWTTPGGDFGSVLAGLSANATTVSAGDKLDWTSAALATAVGSNIGSSINLLGKLATENSTRNIFRFESSRGGPAISPILTLDYTAVPEASAALLSALCLLALVRRRR